jgi:hypothetical protein
MLSHPYHTMWDYAQHAALGGIVLTARSLAGGVLVGNIMHLLVTAAVPTEV